MILAVVLELDSLVRLIIPSMTSGNQLASG